MHLGPAGDTSHTPISFLPPGGAWVPPRTKWPRLLPLVCAAKAILFECSKIDDYYSYGKRNVVFSWGILEIDQETKSPWILVVNLTQFDCMTLNDINSNP